MKKRDEIILRIDKNVYKGFGIGRFNDYVIFVPNAVEGDTLRVSISKKKRNYAEGRIVEILDPSPHRIDPPCHYFGYCGGCKWQNIPYHHQLQIKRRIVEESLRKIGGVEEIRVEETIPATDPYGYRNKIEFTFSARRWLLPEELKDKTISQERAIGFHRPSVFFSVIDIQKCLLQSDLLNQIYSKIRQFFSQNDLPFYHLKEQTGWMRFLVLREARFTGEIMINFISTVPVKDHLMPLVEELSRQFPSVVSIINGIQARPAQIAFTDSYEVLYGREYITEKLDHLMFRISPNSFFQTNSAQTLALYRTVKEMAGLTGKETVWDLYGGTGTIGIFLADRARHVTSIELVDSAVEDARSNARLNGISNIEFIHGDMKKLINQLEEIPDVVVTDPPRDGMHPDVVQALMRRSPKRIVYVSCNPTTLSRDLSILKERYTIKLIRPVDMFPQTYHVETVVAMERIE